MTPRWANNEDAGDAEMMGAADASEFFAEEEICEDCEEHYEDCQCGTDPDDYDSPDDYYDGPEVDYVYDPFWMGDNC